MVKLIIEDDEGRRTAHSCERPEITIGRQEGNTIRLNERNVSRRHARIFRQNGTIFLEDLDSYNGVRVNGKLIEGRASIGEGDRIQIGDYQLAIREERSAEPMATEREELEVWSASSAQPPPFIPEILEAPEATVLELLPDEEPIPVLEPSQLRPLVQIQSDEAPRLLVLNTKYAGQEFTCRRSEVWIGRSPDNDIALDHPSLAKTEARLSCTAGGEWQVIELESSNGVRVNGKAFGKATLQSGDLLKLGRVKLKFVLPVPGAQLNPAVRPSAPRGARNFAVVWTVLLAGVVAGGGLWLVNRQGVGAAVAPTSAFRTGVSQLERAAESSEQAAAAPGSPNAVEPVNSPGDSPQRAQRTKEPEPKLAAAAAAAPVAVEPGVAQSEQIQQVQKLYEEGLSHYRKHQFSAAAASLNDCLRADPGFSKCHMVLGSTYARLREPELGAQHYRRFLQLAPEDPDAAKIKIYLEQYESAKANIR